MKYPKIDITITTFKRRDLFERTMNSFIDTCLDLDLIDRWLVGDDGSSEKDILWMRDKYPFLTIFENPKKGQASNINNLFSKVKTDWFFHMEDDWLFLKQGNYIRKLFDIANDNQLIRNVTLRQWGGNIVERNGTTYNIHQYSPTKDADKITLTNCNWFGYTLNPGIQHLSTVRLLGAYNENLVPLYSRFWDRPQAIKYMEMGLLTANIYPGKYIEHIGAEISAYRYRCGLEEYIK